jgi:hypothetical protein
MFRFNHDHQGAYNLSFAIFYVAKVQEKFQREYRDVHRRKMAIPRLLPIFVSKCTRQENKKWTTIRVDCRKS